MWPSAFITVRTTSTRLPEKCLLPFGEGNVLEHVIRRAKHYGLLPIVCTTTESSDDVVAKISQAEGIECFRGSVRHKLKRWRDCCQAFGVTEFHSVDADDPFFDGDLVKESMMLLQAGYDVVYPPASSSSGVASVGFSMTRSIVERACDQIPEDANTELMWYYLERVDDLKKTVLPEPDSDPPKVRLTLDYPEDYWLLASVRRIVGGLATREEIQRLFERNPDLSQVNWFRNQEWADAQARRKPRG